VIGAPRPALAAARLAVATLLGLAAGTALAHATLVFGVATVSPDPPVRGEPFELTLRLEDPALTPIEDAIVHVELRAMPADGLPAPSTEALDLPPALASARLVETEPAVYRAQLTLTEAGRYHLLVRDQTYPWEEAHASVVLPVNAEVVGRLPFILPPTQVAPRSLWTWLLWLVGLPLVAGAVVTVLVLTSAKKPAPPPSAPPSAATPSGGPSGRRRDAGRRR
jgi:hypothetical protein